jgi:hypothetical protein
VVSKCFATLKNGKPNLEFWPVQVLEFLASRGVLYSNFVPGGIVPAVMAREDWVKYHTYGDMMSCTIRASHSHFIFQHILAVVLKHVQDIPEADLIRVVRTMAEKARVDEAKWKDKFALYFKLVVEAPRNDIFMQQAVKRIGADDLFIVLETLRNWMVWWDEQGGGSSNKSSEAAGVPKFVHVIFFFIIPFCTITQTNTIFY